MKAMKKPKSCYASGGVIGGVDFADNSQAGLEARLANVQQPMVAPQQATIKPEPQSAMQPTQGEISRQGIMADMNSLGTVAAHTGQGAGAGYNWQTKTAPEIAAEASIQAQQRQRPGHGIMGGINPNAPYKPGTAADPMASGIAGRSRPLMAGDTPVPQRRLAPQVQQVDPLAKGIGFAQGGKIRGPGTPTSDSIQAKVQDTGEPIKVSTGERIVSAAQEAALQQVAQQMGFDSVDAMFEQMTGQPVGPTVKGGQRAAANGAVFRDDMTYDQVTNGAQVPPKPAVQMAAGQSPAPTIYGNGGLPADVVQRGIETMRGQLAKPEAAAQVTPVALDPFAYRGGQSYGGKGPVNGPDSTALTPANEAKPTYTLTSGNAESARINGLHQGILGTSQSPAKSQASADANESDLAGRQGAHMATNNLREFRDVGGGITAQRGANGRLAVSNIDTAGITDPTKRAVDDSASARIDQQGSTYNPKQQLENIQRLRLTADLTDPAITDPLLRARAAGALSIMGRPEDRQLKQAQAQGIMAGAESAQAVGDIQRKAIAGDAQAMATYQALTGKNNPSYKAIHAAGGQTMDGKNPDQVFVIDERTGNSRSLTNGQQPVAFGKADVAAALKAGADKAKVAARIKSMGGNPADYGL